MIKKLFRVLLVIVPVLQCAEGVAQVMPPFVNPQCEQWADSMMKTLSPDERIGQLFMVAAYSDTASIHKDDSAKLTKLIQEQKIGGLIFFKGTPTRQAQLCNYYQSISSIPMLIGMDAEWGLAMRLDSVPRFPFQMALGAMQDDSLIFKMGVEIAKECKRLGMQVDFAPVVDINDNPMNPVIGMRSFGDDKKEVTKMGLAYMYGLQSEDVLACAKHFPGHGDAKTDSHLSLPVIDYPVTRLDTFELYPFQTVFNKGMGSTMVAHLYIPSLDSTPHQASTLSTKVIDSLLKKQLNFQGLIFTDALNMKAVAHYYPPGIVDVKALLAGNDVLLFSEDVSKAIEEIKKAIKKKEITQEEIDVHCRKILMTKAWVGLNHYKPVVLKNLTKDLNTPEADYLNRQMAEKSITILSNKKNIIPLQRLDTLRIASLMIGDTAQNIFQSRLGNYASVDNYNMPIHSSDSVMEVIYQKLGKYNLIIIGVNHTNIHPQDTFGITKVAIKMIDTLEKRTSVVLDLFSDPYILDYLPKQTQYASAVIMSYQSTPYLLDYSAQLIFGGIGGKGTLSVSASDAHKRGAGIQTTQTRLEYTVPEELGISSQQLSRIDTIVNYGMTQQAYPGCVVLAAKDGKIFYEKAFGTQNYNDTTKVCLNDVYDLASVTKVAATTLAVMKLTEENKIVLDNTLPSILSAAKKSNKKKILIKDMMLHQAGLEPDIFFYKNTMDGNTYRKGVYSSDSSASYPYPVAKRLYLRKDYKDTILNAILKSPVDKKPVYKYSDLGFILLGFAISNITNTPLNSYVQNNFYTPMGLTTMGYLPLKKMPVSKIIPTEYDTVFRKQLLHGYVHDPSAAMLGGVSGNAGLFSDASDVTALMQMLLQNGSYGGQQYLDSATVKEFASCLDCNSNRRGLGFDKPETDIAKQSPACKSASSESYGHSGFTGTYVWVDPKYGIVYVFLSNRVASGSADNKLAKLNIRTDIQQVIYNAIGVK